MKEYIEKIELLVLKGIRRVYRRFNTLWSHHHVSIMDENVSNYIYEALMGDSPLMLARLGSTEFKAILAKEITNRSIFFRYKCFLMGWIPSIRNIPQIEQEALNFVCFNAGVFPNKREILDVFYREMKSALSIVDILAVWLDEDLLISPVTARAHTHTHTHTHTHAPLNG